jgi:hypothetical protein
MKDFFILSFSLLFCMLIYAQEPSDDPLTESYVIQVGGGKEIAAIDYNGNISIYKYFHNTKIFAHDTLIKSLSYHLPVTDYIQFTDIICDDFDHDGLAEIAAVWTDPADQANLVLLKPDQALLSIDTLARWEKINLQSVIGLPVVFLDRWELLYPVLIKSGNFDNDEQQEIVIAYWAQQGIGQYFVRILLYDVSDSLEVTLLGEIMDQEITVPPEIELCEDRLQLFDIECADLNGDQIDEIVLAGRTGSGAEGWEIFTNIYSWDTLATELVRDSHATLFSRTDHVYDIQYFNMATGNFSSSEKESGVLGFSLYQPLPWNPSFVDTVSYVLIQFEADESLQNITAGEAVVQWQDTIENACRDRLGTLICEDVNNDGLDEIISSFELGEYKTFQIL